MATKPWAEIHHKKRCKHGRTGKYEPAKCVMCIFGEDNITKAGCDKCKARTWHDGFGCIRCRVMREKDPWMI